MSVIVLYHYTDKVSAKKIKESGKILQSRQADNNVDAVFGDGVYMTAMSPDNAKELLAKNNFDDVDLPLLKIQEGKLDWYIKVTIRKNDRKLKQVGKRSGRNIYLYKGDVILDDMEDYDIQKIEEE